MMTEHFECQLQNQQKLRTTTTTTTTTIKSGFYEYKALDY